jgi:hypothetical protein
MLPTLDFLEFCIDTVQYKHVSVSVRLEERFVNLFSSLTSAARIRRYWLC